MRALCCARFFPVPHLSANSLPSVGGDTSGGGGSSSFRSFGEQELLLLRTASFLASSSALLRTQMQGVWTERRAMTTALAAAGDEFGAGFGAGGGAGGVSATAGKAALPAVSKDQQSEVSWILQTLPRCVPPPPPARALELDMIIEPPSPSDPIPPPPPPPQQDLTPTPLPLPVISHQPPYCTLEFPLERISAEWRTVFPPEVLAAGTSGGGGTTDASERDRLEFEAILEDVWDSIQSNRALYEEYSAAAPKGAGGATSGPAALPPTGTTSPSGGQAAAAWRAESGESVMSHAMENFGFLLNPAIRAAMMGQHSSVTAAAAAANSTATVTAAGATSTATKTGTPATGLGLAAAAAANTTLSATAGATGGYMPYEFDEADSPSNIIMESDQASGAQDGPSGGGGAGAAAAAAATAAASAAAAAAAAAAAGSPSSASGAAASRNIKCATLNKLIERVTHEKYVDLNTRYVFLLTYHSFTTPRELLSKLSSRFHVPLPPNLSPEELLHFKTFKLDRIQIRVCSVLKNWLDEHWTADFAGDPTLKRELQTLINSMLENSGSLLTSQLAKALNALLKKKERMSSGPGGNTGSIVVQSSAVGAALVAAGAAGSGRPASSLSPGASSSAASSASPSSGVSVPPKLLISSRLTLDSFNLMDVDETELARQLTLIDFDKFKSIQPRECLNQNWSRALAIKSVLAPNILAMISQFNKVSLWVEIQILKQKELKMRAKYFEKFIKIAEVRRAAQHTSRRHARADAHTERGHLRSATMHECKFQPS